MFGRVGEQLSNVRDALAISLEKYEPIATVILGYHCEEDPPLGFHCCFRKWILRTRLTAITTATLMTLYNSLICMISSLIAQVEYQWREDRSPKRAQWYR